MKGSRNKIIFLDEYNTLIFMYNKKIMIFCYFETVNWEMKDADI